MQRSDARNDSSARRLVTFELFVGRGFSDYEAAAVTGTLLTANRTLGEDAVSWRFVSDKPGLITGATGMIVRADPVIDNHNLPDALVVVGGTSGRVAAWLPRLRQMQRMSRTVALLSDAATAYIQKTKAPSGKVTTHWRDAISLAESGHHPSLTNRLSEISDGIITSGGAGSTEELILGLLAPQIPASIMAELSNRLLLSVVRKSHAEQPKDITDNPAIYDPRVISAVKVMEENLELPLQIADIARQINSSTRHLERVFKDIFKLSPGRFYKQLRTKRARAMLEETQLSMMEVAIATGFGSSGTMNAAIKQEYGLTATQMRARSEARFLTF